MNNVVHAIRDYMNYCRNQKHLSNNTMRAYTIDMKQFINFLYEKGYDKLDVNEVTKDILKIFVERLQFQYTVRTCKRKIACIKAFFNYLEEEDIISVNPFRKIRIRLNETRNLPKTIKKQDVVRQLEYAYKLAEKANTLFRRYYAIRALTCYEILISTGMRIGEISNLKSDSIDLDAKCIRIIGKGNKERMAYITSASVIQAIKNYNDIKEKLHISSRYFFTTIQGERMSEESARMFIRYVGEATVGKHITPHMFRHTFASMLLELNVDIRYIQELLGHSSINTTQIYLHLINTSIRASLERANLREQLLF